MHSSKNYECTTHTNTNKYHLRISNGMDAGCKCIFIIRFLRKLLRPERGRCCHRRQRLSYVDAAGADWKKCRTGEKRKNANDGICNYAYRAAGDWICVRRHCNILFVRTYTYEKWAPPCVPIELAKCSSITFASKCVRVCVWCGVFQFGETSNKQIIGKRYASLLAPFVISRRMSCKHHSGTSTIIQMYTDTVSGVQPMPSISDSNFTHIVIVHGRYKQELM